MKNATVPNAEPFLCEGLVPNIPEAVGNCFISLFVDIHTVSAKFKFSLLDSICPRYESLCYRQPELPFFLLCLGMGFQETTMYIESKPISIHQQNLVANMECPRPQLRRPPILLDQSSSSSLRGMERAIPSFQSFVKRTPPVPSKEKPLPSVPQDDTRYSTQSASTDSRRSSSIYSRTVSQWASTPLSWQSRDFASSDMFLQPSLYSLSTPELIPDTTKIVESNMTFLQPRAYAPLLRSPSPSPSPSVMHPSSRNGLELDFEDHRLSNLLPPAESWKQLAYHHVKTVSLDKEFATAQAPNTQIVLPEGMRASAAAKNHMIMLRKSQSSEGLDIPKAQSPRDYYQLPSWSSHAALAYNQRDSKLSDGCFGTNSYTRAAVTPVAVQQSRRGDMRPFKNNVSNTSEEDYEDRGRARGRSRFDVELVIVDTPADDRPVPGRPADNAALISAAECLAREYHKLLPLNNSSPVRKGKDSTLDGRDVKLAPQPLFFNPRQISKQRIDNYQRERFRGNMAYQLPFRRDDYSSPASLRRNDLSLAYAFPLKLSLAPDSTRSNSTIDSIPISPPPAISRTADPSLPRPSYKKPSLHSPKPSNLSPGKPRKASVDDSNRFSALYPKAGSPTHSSGGKRQKTSTTTTPPLPGATVVATRAEAEAAFNSKEPVVILDYSRKANHKHKNSGNSGDSINKHNLKNPLNAVGEKMSLLTSVFQHSPNKRAENRSPSTVHWPRVSTSLTDGPRAPTLTISPPIIRHVDTPKPAVVEDNKKLIAEPSGFSMQKRPSLFAHVIDHRRASKANRRREELKKTIRMVPEEYSSQHSGRGGAHQWV